MAAATCADANAASTAAIVLGEAAPAWLSRAGLAARLVRGDGRVVDGRRLAGRGAGVMTDRAIWYLMRGSGITSLLLLTAVVALGILTSRKASLPTLPRFATMTLHRSISLLAVVFLVLHVASAVIDPYAQVHLLDLLVPFAGSRQALMLGLGTLALDLFAAVIVSSLLMKHVGRRLWRTIHWFGYGVWPLAFVHTLGMGSDSRTIWAARAPGKRAARHGRGARLARSARAAAAYEDGVAWRAQTDRERPREDGSADEARVLEQQRVDAQPRPAQCVSVTLRRPAGRSGSRPRRVARRSARSWAGITSRNGASSSQGAAAVGSSRPAPMEWTAEPRARSSSSSRSTSGSSRPPAWNTSAGVALVTAAVGPCRRSADENPSAQTAAVSFNLSAASRATA